ncbi:MAG: apolipoprotein acyltransferase [Pseudomonadota bacterium]
MKMIVILGAMCGAVIGGVTAHKRKGNRLDIAQYAAGYALAFTVVAMILTVILDRTLI